MIAKARWLKWHRRVGLTVAALLFIQASTGVTMVFRDAIDRVIHPELAVTPTPSRLPVQTLVDTVRQAHPKATLTRAEFPASSGGTVLFKLKSESGAQILTAVDPYDGRIVRDGGLGSWPTEWLFNVHEQLLAGPVGETIVGCEGLCLIFLAIAGTMTWWPGRKRLRQGFRVKLDGSNEVRWRTLHRAVGAGVAAFALLSATTGVLMVWKPTVRTVIGAPDRPAPKVAKQSDRPLLPVDQLIAKAERAYGPAPLEQVRFSSDGRVIAVFLHSRRTIQPDGTAQAYYDAYTGAELGRYDTGALPASATFVEWLYTVHTGLWGGIATRLILLCTGIVLAGLAFTGPWLWYVRTFRKRRRSRT